MQELEAKNTSSTATFTIEWWDNSISPNPPGPRKRPDLGLESATQSKKKKTDLPMTLNTPVAVSKSCVIPKGTGYLYRKSLEPRANSSHPSAIPVHSRQASTVSYTKPKPKIEESSSMFRMKRKKAVGHAVNYRDLHIRKRATKLKKSWKTEELPVDEAEVMLTDSQLSVGTFTVETDRGDEEERERGKSPEGSVKSWLSECDDSVHLAQGNFADPAVCKKPPEEEKQRKRKRRSACIWASGPRLSGAVCKHLQRPSTGLSEDILTDGGVKSRRTLSEPCTSKGFVWRSENESGMSGNSSLAHMNCDDPEEFSLWKRVPAETKAWETALYKTRRSWSVLSLAAFRNNRLSDTPGGILQILRNGDCFYRRKNSDPCESIRFSSDVAVCDTFDVEPSIFQKNIDIRNWVNALWFHEPRQEQDTAKDSGVGAFRTLKTEMVYERGTAAAHAPLFYFQMEQLLNQIKCQRQDILQSLSNLEEPQATLGMTEQALPTLGIFLLGVLLVVNFVVCELRQIVSNVFRL